MAESEEELKSLLMKVKEESEKVGLKLNFQCREPAWGFLPVAKVMRKGACQNAKAGSGLRGPPGFSRVSTPKTRVCLLYYIMPFNYSSNINRGLSPHHLFREKVNLELLDNKSLGIIRVFQSKNPSDGFLACLTRLSGLLQLCM